MSITGISPNYQNISLYGNTESKQSLASLNDENLTLEAYGVKDGQCLRVSLKQYPFLDDSQVSGILPKILQIDNTDPTARPGEWNDTTGVEKFELTQEEYESRNGNFLFLFPSASERAETFG